MQAYGSVTEEEVVVVEKEIIIEEEKAPWTFETLVPYLAVKYGQNEVLAREIIRCESGSNPIAKGDNFHFELRADEEGVERQVWVLWSSDHGYWQVNDFYHELAAKQMGLDIYNWEENLEYGFILLSRDGTRHWKASAYCWDTV